MQSFGTWEHGPLAQWCMYQNKVTLIGFLGSNAEVRTNSDRSFTTLSLATKSSYKKDDEYISHTDGTVASFSASSRSGLRRGELTGLTDCPQRPDQNEITTIGIDNRAESSLLRAGSTDEVGSALPTF
jgi:hypothetical protein